MQFAPPFDGAAGVHMATDDGAVDLEQIVARPAKRAKHTQDLCKSGIASEAVAGRATALVTQAAPVVVPGSSNIESGAVAGRATVDVTQAAPVVLSCVTTEATLRSAIAEAFAEALAPMCAQLRGLDTRVANMEAQLTQVQLEVEARFDGMIARLDGVGARLDGVNTRLGGIDSRLAGLHQQETILQAQRANQRREEPHEVLQPVPNQRGDAPSQLPHGTTVAQLEALSADAVKACLNHYALSHAGRLEELRMRLRRQLGVRRLALL
ncbi:hypothetical protein JKP88DRAFT_241375 [Tribonema minus]|uniref:Mug135-like C-terminal domain-containing protein n=1 Tax=Tribonema minus TaxID=303371 RepID=A0A835YXF6_9STRA|nr:hypothetical protein JKP88DRAFT_241375 [Tribonema minus]